MSQQILKEFCCLPAFLEQYFGVPKTSFKKKYFENPQIPKAISEPSPKKKWGFLILDSLEKNFTEPSANCSKVFGAFKAPPPLLIDCWSLPPDRLSKQRWMQIA